MSTVDMKAKYNKIKFLIAAIYLLYTTIPDAGFGRGQP